MDYISLPTKIKYTETDKPNTSIITVEPCQAGFGTTLGNALRRVLLSSMPGYAVSAIKIKGVDHEFSSIPKVKEDVIEIILNLKKLFIKFDSEEEEIRLKLSTKGKKVVTAADIEDNSAVEIMNKDLEICHLTDEKATFEMDLIVTKGYGYDPTESRTKDKSEVGLIAIDAIYTPVLNVGYKVENVRVGGITNYDKLILTIETDGTITANEAVKRSSDLLVKHFNLINGEDVDNESIIAEAPGIEE